MNTEKMREVLERWVSNNIKKEFDPINIDDVYAAFEAGAKWQAARAGGDGEAVFEINHGPLDENGFIEYTEFSPLTHLDGVDFPSGTKLYARPPAPAAKVPDIIEYLTEADGCFEAALCEGWNEAINDGDTDRLIDLWHRRLEPARLAIIQALSAAQTPEGGE